MEINVTLVTQADDFYNGHNRTWCTAQQVTKRALGKAAIDTASYKTFTLFLLYYKVA